MDGTQNSVPQMNSENLKFEEGFDKVILSEAKVSQAFEQVKHFSSI